MTPSPHGPRLHTAIESEYAEYRTHAAYAQRKMRETENAVRALVTHARSEEQAREAHALLKQVGDLSANLFHFLLKHSAKGNE